MVDYQDNDFSFEEDSSTPAYLILQQLTKTWVNEKNSPALLKYATEVVDCMMDQIEQMDENLQNLTRDDFRLVPHQMEVNRIKYLLASYHRCRLRKIEKFCVFLVSKDTAADQVDKIMSPTEFIFAKEFIAMRNVHFTNEALRYLPNAFSGCEVQDEVVPFFKSAVFIDVVRPCQNILVAGSDDEIELTLGSRHLLPFENVTKLVSAGSVALI